MINQRLIALNILSETIASESYANLLMRKELNKIPLINRPFVSELVYGALRNYDLLMYQLSSLIKENTKLRLKHILILGLYEHFFMNNKDYAIVNEYVDLCEDKYEKGFVNSILRNTLEMKYSDKAYINNSLPEWIFNLISRQYDDESLKNILNIYKNKSKTYYRLNTNKATFKDLKHLNIEIIDDHYFTSLVPLNNSLEFKNGLFYIQDINSSVIVSSLDLNKDDLFLDMCSAPGSKLFNALEVIKPENAYSNDIHENRLELIKKASKRLGYNNINYLNYDGTILKDVLNIKFNKILLDAPCSGLGVISRRPDLKFHISPSSLDELEIIQSNLLESAYSLLDNDGILVYSTCTINRKENDRQIAKFIANHQDLIILKEETIIKDGGDMFYLAKIKKV